ncbi:GAF and ANTAR domain-containing protein [Streptomyces sp. ITFR-21]|nr:GAF and ANTAR domain-containing protein [Streptomyces sp. ITFR-21]WNI16421.1 GAF and ANTAR domain-containing protein [Streptomyces sp. ITFR-21]
MARPLRLMEIFVELADSLIDDFDVIDFLQRLSSRCVELLDVPAAGILLADQNGELQAVAASDEHTRLLELFALQQAQGPCVDCYRSGVARVNIDLTDPAVTKPWEAFALRAGAAGFQVTHAIPLRVRDRVVGALNLFHTDRGQLPPEDIALAQAMADIATIAILQQRTLDRSHIETTQLQNALNTRVVIEQAKGVLAERWNSDVDQAFTALRTYARFHNLRISDLAHAVIDGRLDTLLIPPPPPPPPPPSTTDGRLGRPGSAPSRGRRL